MPIVAAGADRGCRSRPHRGRLQVHCNVESALISNWPYSWIEQRDRNVELTIGKIEGNYSYRDD